MLKEKLLAEIVGLNTTVPNVRMFVDDDAIFWLSESGHYVHMAKHNGLVNYYADEDHQVIEAPKAGSNEGVGPTGIIWANREFTVPFTLADFIEQINSITR